MAQDEATPRPAPEVPDTGRHKVATVLFAVMLLLALVGMALSMSREGGVWEVWGVVLLFYGAVSVAWGWQNARARGEPIARSLRLQALHWSLVLVGLLVLLLFERTDILSRQAASTVALLFLALACLLAGVHFDWMFLLLGLVLTVMTVAIAYFEQVFVWLVMIPVLGAAAFLYLRLRGRRDASS